MSFPDMTDHFFIPDPPVDGMLPVRKNFCQRRRPAATADNAKSHIDKGNKGWVLGVKF